MHILRKSRIKRISCIDLEMFNMQFLLIISQKEWIMRIINHRVNDFFNDQAAKPCRGFLTGPIKVTMAVAQIAINLVGLIFSPLTCCCRKENSEWSAKKTFRHIIGGFGNILRGICDTIPGTSFVLPNTKERRLIRSLTPDVSSDNSGDCDYNCDMEGVRSDLVLMRLRDKCPNKVINYDGTKFSWSLKPQPAANASEVPA